MISLEESAHMLHIQSLNQLKCCVVVEADFRQTPIMRIINKTHMGESEQEWERVVCEWRGEYEKSRLVLTESSAKVTAAFASKMSRAVT